MLTPSSALFDSDCFLDILPKFEGWTGLFALIGIFISHLLQIFACSNLVDENTPLLADDQEALVHDQSHSKSSLYSLEIGIALHSVLIGITLGTSTEEFMPLLIAISAHQFFEGMALASLIFEAPIDQLQAFGLLAFYSLGTPIGIALGISLREACIF
jgi:zinc transporter 1/2/3